MFEDGGGISAFSWLTMWPLRIGLCNKIYNLTFSTPQPSVSGRHQCLGSIAPVKSAGHLRSVQYELWMEVSVRKGK